MRYSIIKIIIIIVIRVFIQDITLKHKLPLSACVLINLRQNKINLDKTISNFYYYNFCEREYARYR